MTHSIRCVSFGKWLWRLSLIVLALATLTSAGNAQTVYPHHAGLMIEFGDGGVYTKCIDLGDDDQATGYEVLQAAGDLTLIADFSYGLGAAMCKINQQGCNFPAESCFCQCQLINPNDTCQYWSYWHLVGDHWQYSSTGSSAYTVQSGAVEGWAWGTGSTTSAAPPPLLTFNQICAPATATPTSTSTATAIPTQAVVIPSATWTPTATPPLQPALSDTPSPWPTHIPTAQIATPAPAVGSTVTPRPTAPPSVVPQVTPTLAHGATLSSVGFAQPEPVSLNRIEFCTASARLQA